MHAEPIARPWKGTARNCEACGTEFKLRARATQRFCSRRCAATTNHTPRTLPAVPWQERFWRYVPDPRPAACWEWTGSRDQHGYGRLNRGRQGAGIVKAHRASWEIHHGPIPDGLAVCHRCDNPPCCNPEHLFLGTLKVNTQDMMTKGRQVAPSGAGNGKTVYADAIIQEIRVAAAEGETYDALAARFGLTSKYICAVVLGRRRAAAGGPIRG